MGCVQFGQSITEGRESRFLTLGERQRIAECEDLPWRVREESIDQGFGLERLSADDGCNHRSKRSKGGHAPSTTANTPATLAENEGHATPFAKATTTATEDHGRATPFTESAAHPRQEGRHPSKAPATGLPKAPVVLGRVATQGYPGREADGEGGPQGVDPTAILPKGLVDLIPEGLGLTVEAPDVEEGGVGVCPGSPSPHIVPAIDQLIHPREDVCGVHRNRHSPLQARQVWADAKAHIQRPTPAISAGVPRGKASELISETVHDPGGSLL
jgi:hypothetical protein